MIPTIRMAFAFAVALLPYFAGQAGAQTTKDDAKKILGPGGGTILQYEINRHKDDREVDIKLLAEALKRRIDPNDLHNFTIRPAGEVAIEIILPAKGKRPDSKDLTGDDVLRIKDLISKVGSLEFRILANRFDDKAAIEDCEKLINGASDHAEVAKDLEAAQTKGLPPAVHQEIRQKERQAKQYVILTARGEKSTVTYSWVELGPHERRALDLDNAAADDPKRGDRWKEAALNRGKATALTEGADRKLLHGALFYSRECQDRNLPEEDRRKKKVEYFVLARNPEIIDGKQTPRVDGSFLTSAASSRSGPVVNFTFNTKGGNLFGNLTRKNVPSDDDKLRRHLAIILDGQVLSAPTINSEIRTQGQISGNFTQKEVDDLVNILRAGALPATLKPQPVSETTIGIAPEPKGVRRIPIPHREHGYGNFKSRVIGSQEQLDAFLKAAEKQSGWNNRDEFLAALRKAKLDFNAEVLVLVRQNEGSGSTKVTFLPTELRGETLVCRIEREAPGIGTADIADYCFAVAVARKQVVQVEIIVGKSKPFVLKVPTK